MPLAEDDPLFTSILYAQDIGDDSCNFGAITAFHGSLCVAPVIIGFLSRYHNFISGCMNTTFHRTTNSRRVTIFQDLIEARFLMKSMAAFQNATVLIM
mmetsp:Transcript_14725/g.37046  ORF Transcript_14725/g.37046 Transcript_14725/m.37046 type:complete len:98 (+) Transcript_14725:108-401(+)